MISTLATAALCERAFHGMVVGILQNWIVQNKNAGGEGGSRGALFMLPIGLYQGLLQARIALGCFFVGCVDR